MFIWVFYQGIEERQVTQYQYTDWYTTQVPSSVDSVLMFRNLIMSDVTENDGPIIVHCRYNTQTPSDSLFLCYCVKNKIHIVKRTVHQILFG